MPNFKSFLKKYLKFATFGFHKIVNLPRFWTFLGDGVFCLFEISWTVNLPRFWKSLGNFFSSISIVFTINLPILLTSLGDGVFDLIEISWTVNLPYFLTSLGEGVLGLIVRCVSLGDFFSSETSVFTINLPILFSPVEFSGCRWGKYNSLTENLPFFSGSVLTHPFGISDNFGEVFFILGGFFITGITDLFFNGIFS